MTAAILWQVFPGDAMRNDGVERAAEIAKVDTRAHGRESAHFAEFHGPLLLGLSGCTEQGSSPVSDIKGSGGDYTLVKWMTERRRC